MTEHVLIIGAMKAATTTLHHLLATDGAFVEGDQKELNYFLKNQSASAYSSDLRRSHKALFTLESSTNYTKLHEWFGMSEDTIPKRIAMLGSGVKLIYIVRDPLERLESHLHHDWHRHSRPMNFSQIWRAAEVSRYADQIDRYLKFFDKSQLFVGSSEALYKDQRQFLACLSAFLGHDISFNSESIYRNRGKSSAPLSEAYSSIKSSVAEDLLPVTERLAFQHGVVQAESYLETLFSCAKNSP